jgi:tetratricopeptide (TPR) repeat protein
MGNALAGVKDVDGAIAQIEEAIDADPQRVLTYTNLGTLKLAKRDSAAAESIFKRAIEIDPKSTFARLALGNYYWATADFAAAEREFKIALQNEPKSLSTNRVMAVFLLTNGRQSECEPYLRAYADVAPDAGAKIVLADYYLIQKRTPEAIAILQGLLARQDGFVSAKRRLAALDFRGRPPERGIRGSGRNFQARTEEPGSPDREGPVSPGPKRDFPKRWLKRTLFWPKTRTQSPDTT